MGALSSSPSRSPLRYGSGAEPGLSPRLCEDSALLCPDSGLSLSLLSLSVSLSVSLCFWELAKDWVYGDRRE